MSETYNENSIARLKHLASLATRVKTELDALDGKTFSSVDVSGGKINFYATTDHTGTALESIDLPEEIFLDQTQTAFIQSFAWSNVAYPGSTNPNLEGKPVLVLAVKGDKTTNPTLTYSFVNLEKLVDTYTAADNAIGISGYSIGLNLAAGATNILSIENDGLLAELKLGGASQYNIATFGASGYIADGGLSIGDVDARNKVDKVTSAVTGNIVTFGASGAIADSGYTFASDTDVSNMLTDIFSTTYTPKQTRNIALAVTKINPSNPSSNLVQDIANDVTEVDAIVPNNGTLQIWLKNDHNDVDVFPTYSYSSEDGITAEFYYTQKNLYGDGNGYVENKWKIFSYAAGKSITFTVNLAESAAYAAYTRTITFNLVSAS